MNSGDGTLVGFVGAGNMAFAICSGMISAGVVEPGNVWASAPTSKNLKKFQDLGCHGAHKNFEVLRRCKIVILCVKPTQIQAVWREFNIMERCPEFIVSVISGASLSYLEKNLRFPTKIIRLLPNTPVQVCAGVIAYAMNDTAEKEGGDDMVQHYFGKIALCKKVPESLFCAITGVSGSGSAFVYTVIQAMADGAVKAGLPRELAVELAAQTVLGSGKTVLETGKHPIALRDAVCSPAGTTIAGVHALERAAVGSAFMDAVQAAATRAAEQGQELKEQQQKGEE